MSLTLAAKRGEDPGAPSRPLADRRSAAPCAPPRTSPPAGRAVGTARCHQHSRAASTASSRSERRASRSFASKSSPGGAASARAGGTDPDASEGPRRGNVETSRPSSEAPSRSFSAGPPSAGPPSRFCHSAASREQRSATSSLRLASSRCCAAWICVWSWYAAALKWYPTPRWYRSCVMSQSLVTGKTPKARASSRGRASRRTPPPRDVRARTRRRRRRGAAPSARTSGGPRAAPARRRPRPRPRPPERGRVRLRDVVGPPNRGRSSWCASESWGWAAPPGPVPPAPPAPGAARRASRVRRREPWGRVAGPRGPVPRELRHLI